MPTPITHALGQGESFEFDGKSYTLAPWKFGPVQARYEQYLHARAYKNILHLRDKLPEDEYLEIRNDLRRDIDGGRYAFFGKVAWDSIDDPANSRYLFFLCLKAASPLDEAITEGLVTRIYDDPVAGPHAFDLMYRMNLDPNSLAQRKTKTPSGPDSTSSNATPSPPTSTTQSSSPPSASAST